MYGKSLVIVLKGLQLIIKEVLTNSIVMGNKMIGRFVKT